MKTINDQAVMQGPGEGPKPMRTISDQAVRTGAEMLQRMASSGEELATEAKAIRAYLADIEREVRLSAWRLASIAALLFLLAVVACGTLVAGLVLHLGAR
jgi:hypothetical protein